MLARAMPSTLAPIAPISRCSASTVGRGSCARNEFAQLGDEAFDRREQIVARPVLARSGDPLAEVAYRALERDDGVSRRQIGEAARHRGEFGAQTLDIGGGRLASFGLFATQLVEALAQLGDLGLEGARRALLGGDRLCDDLGRGVPDGRGRLDGARDGRGFGGKAAPAASGGFRFAVGGSRVELLPTTRDLGDRVADVETPADGARRVAVGLVERLQPPRQIVDALGDVAGGVRRRLRARRGPVRRGGARRLLGGDPFFEAGQPADHRPKGFLLVALPGLAALDPGRHRIQGARRARLALGGAAFESRDRRVEQFVGARRFTGGRRRGGRARGVRLAFARRAPGGGVVASGQAGELFADRVQSLLLIQILGVDALFGGLFGDDVVEPFAKAHAGAAGGLLRSLPRLAADTPDAPSSGSVHWRHLRRGSRIEAPPARIGAAPRSFGMRGEEIVNGAPKLAQLRNPLTTLVVAL